jgi:hypothetical protein
MNIDSLWAEVGKKDNVASLQRNCCFEHLHFYSAHTTFSYVLSVCQVILRKDHITLMCWIIVFLVYLQGKIGPFFARFIF